MTNTPNSIIVMFCWVFRLLLCVRVFFSSFYYYFLLLFFILHFLILLLLACMLVSLYVVFIVICVFNFLGAPSNYGFGSFTVCMFFLNFCSYSYEFLLGRFTSTFFVDLFICVLNECWNKLNGIWNKTIGKTINEICRHNIIYTEKMSKS